MIEIPYHTFRVPPGFRPYIVTFKHDDIHPMDKVPMAGRAVRIFAPNVDRCREVVQHRFGKAFHHVYDERTKTVTLYPNGIYEQLIWIKI
jgi:hypothetical protein